MSLVPSNKDPAAYIAEILALNEKLQKALNIALKRFNDLESVHLNDVSKIK
jgi:hypothetical protein